MTRTQVFAPQPARLTRAKRAMAVLDAGAVMLVLARGIASGSPHPTALGMLAIAMFVWHWLENVTWPARWGVTGAPLYPAGRVWIHGAYTFVLGVAAIDILLAARSVERVPTLTGWTPQVFGLILFVLGVGLRLAAFSARGAHFLAAPEVAGPPARRGVYAFTRHPAQVGAIAVAIGSALALGSMLGVVTAVIVSSLAARAVARRDADAWRSA